MTEIKAIETKYNGYHFRSRLEARWAVFFDALQLRYEYEPEGFDLGEHGWYLPDFYLPDIEWYVEIKPDTGRRPTKESKDKCQVFGSMRNLIILTGTPGVDSYMSHIFLRPQVIIRGQFSWCGGDPLAVAYDAARSARF